MQEGLSGLRKEIDACDDIIVNTFIKRMKIAGRISEYKKANNIETLDKKREYDLKQRILQSTDDDFKCYMSELFDKILELSKKYQEELRKNSWLIVKQVVKVILIKFYNNGTYARWLQIIQVSYPVF